MSEYRIEEIIVDDKHYPVDCTVHTDDQGTTVYEIDWPFELTPASEQTFTMHGHFVEIGDG